MAVDGSQRCESSSRPGKRKQVPASPENYHVGSVETDEEATAAEEREIDRLEREVKILADRLVESRRSLPGQISSAFSSRLVALRPMLPPDIQSYLALPSTDHSSGELLLQAELHAEESPTEVDQEMLEKMNTLRAKISNNLAAMPVLLERINNCVARIDELDQCDFSPHSVFRRKEMRWPS